MNSVFASSGQGYGAEAIMFAFSIVLLTLPLAALFVGAFFERWVRHRPSRRDLVPEPLRLRSFKPLRETQSL